MAISSFRALVIHLTSCLLVTLPNIAQARELTMCIDPRFAKQGELKVYTN